MRIHFNSEDKSVMLLAENLEDAMFLYEVNLERQLKSFFKGKEFDSLLKNRLFKYVGIKLKDWRRNRFGKIRKERVYHL